MKKVFLIPIFFFSLTVAQAQYTKLIDFSGVNPPYYGSNSWGDLMSDGIFFYGMTRDGGTNNKGMIFKIKPDGSGYADLHDFGGVADGTNPEGSLIFDGSYLYGMTLYGGTNTSCMFGCGTIFKIKPDGTGYLILHNFSDSPDGKYPPRSLFYDGTFLYGMTNFGGMSSAGAIFKIKPDGGSYTILFNFSGVNGIDPWGSLISDGTFLYGTTTDGGTNSAGVIFKIKPDGTGFTKILNFKNDTLHGVHPGGNLIYDGTFLYGTTQLGGLNNTGTIFKIKPDGSGYVKLFDYSNTNGYPNNALVSDGLFLYGMDKTLFRIKNDGTAYTTLFTFTPTNGNGSSWGSLISDGIFLYGMTNSGGTNSSCPGGCGVIFKYQFAPTGIVESDKQDNILILPNPFSYTATLQTENPFHNATLTVYNYCGQVVKQIKNISGQTIVLSREGLISGLYFLRLTEENKIYTDKIIITD